MKPRIAIPVPTSADTAYNQRFWPDYAEAVRCSGGEAVPVPLTLTPTELRHLAAECQGILLTGSPADVDPSRYGADRDPATAPADSAREAVDYGLLDDALRHRKPVLAICFGCQSLNVWRGGTLVQDLMPMPVNHSAGAQVAIAHAAVIARDNILASLADPAEAATTGDYLRLPINSSHHQSVGIVGDGLRVLARSAEDGVVEAIGAEPQLFHVEQLAAATNSPSDPEHKLFHVEHSAHPMLLGVQWHPERSFAISATSRNLFHRLIADACN